MPGPWAVAQKRARSRDAAPSRAANAAETKAGAQASTPVVLPPPPPSGSVVIETYPHVPTNISPATKVILCGSFPPVNRAMDFFYPNLQNDMWRILGSIFYTSVNHFFSEAPNHKGKGTRRAFNTDAIQQFVRDHPDFGFCDVAKRIIRRNNDASDKGLEVVEEFDFAHDILPKAPACAAVITTGTLALTTLLRQRANNIVPGSYPAPGQPLKQLTPVGGKAARLPKLPVPPIGETVTWSLPVPPTGAKGDLETQRSVDIYRAPSTSRAYPRPLSEKEAYYRHIISRHCSLSSKK